MQKIIIFSAIALLSFAAMAQDRKVAVFDPAGSVESSLKEIVREEISSIIVNTGGFTVLERQLIEKVLEENRFQTGGLVDDSQISEIGKRMGANLVFVSNITPLGANYYVSCKMIDVMTARIEMQKTAQTQRGSSDLMQIVQRMVNEMFADTPKPSVTSRQTNQPVVEEKPVLPPSGRLIADGRKVYQGGRQLSKSEVCGLMMNTDAIRMYNKSLSRNRNGNIWLWSGVALIASGTVIIVTEPFYYDGGNYHDAVGALCMLAGGGMTVTGITLKATSKKPVRKAVDMYNSGSARAGMELDFGFTGNGIGVALRF